MASRIFSNLKVLDLISVETILVGFSLGARGLALSNDINDITAGSLLRTLAPQGPALFACCSVLISISWFIILFHSISFATFLCPGLAGLEDPVCVWGFVKNQIYSTQKRTIEFFLALDYHLMISSHSSDICWPFHNEVNQARKNCGHRVDLWSWRCLPQSWKRLIRTNNDVQTRGKRGERNNMHITMLGRCTDINDVTAEWFVWSCQHQLTPAPHLLDMTCFTGH